MENFAYTGKGKSNPNNSVIRTMSRKNNRKNSRKAERKNNGAVSRKNSRKQRGGRRGGAALGEGGIFHSRIAGPASSVLRVANRLVGDEIGAVRKVVGGVFDGVADAVNGLGRGANGFVRSVAKVVRRKSRKNNRH